ncbi:MAG: MarR family winged helix-turn-helix transcriptional regulator [Caldilineaceae bacterium]|jgi:DNA-binding MarR family transcriptional regulator
MSKDKLAAFVQTRRRDATLLTWFRFIRVLKKLLPQMDEHLRNWDLSQGQFDLLAEIAAEEGINQQTCANRLNVTKGNITQHLSNLEKRGYIQREKSGRDNVVSLTDEGRTLFSTIMPAHDQFVKEVLAALTAEEIRQFATILRKLDRSLE